MERVEYDPEIDPSIREEREAAERERELSARIRIEIERYVADNDLVPRSEARSGGETRNGGDAPLEEEAPENDVSENRRQTKREAKEAARLAKDEAREAEREAKRAKNSARAAGRRKAVQSVFTGSILSSEWVRKMWPYLLGVAVVLMGYIAYNFHVQSLHLDRQRLETEVRELGIEAVERTAERVRQTRRSAIVERLRKKEIPLEEFPHPVKKIER